jgi:hypothetical protein
MDRELVSEQPHELRYLAETHGTSVQEIEKVIKEVGSRSRRLVEEELDRRFKHRSRGASPDAGRAAGSQGQPRSSRPDQPD